MVSEVVSEMGMSSHCRSWQLGPATVGEKKAWLLMAGATDISESLAHALCPPLPASGGFLDHCCQPCKNKDTSSELPVWNAWFLEKIFRRPNFCFLYNMECVCVCVPVLMRCYDGTISECFSHFSHTENQIMLAAKRGSVCPYCQEPAIMNY